MQDGQHRRVEADRGQAAAWQTGAETLGCQRRPVVDLERHAGINGKAEGLGSTSETTLPLGALSSAAKQALAILLRLDPTQHTALRTPLLDAGDAPIPVGLVERGGAPGRLEAAAVARNASPASSVPIEPPSFW